VKGCVPAEAVVTVIIEDEAETATLKHVEVWCFLIVNKSQFVHLAVTFQAQL